MPYFEGAEDIKVAVVTGEHPFDVPGFHRLFRSIRDIDFYPQHLDDFAADAGGVRKQYDAVVFYNMNMAMPGGEDAWWEQDRKEALEELGETRQGIFLLHHALLAFRDWRLWSNICGIADRSLDVHEDQTVRIEIADPNHPITEGLEPWEMADETYTMHDAGEGSEILLTTDHPRSMRTLAWTRRYRNARVFCLQSGHDNQTYADPHFRRVVSRGIQWVAGRI